MKTYEKRDSVNRTFVGFATREDYKLASADKRAYNFTTPMPKVRGFVNRARMVSDGTTTSWPVGAIPVRS